MGAMGGLYKGNIKPPNWDAIGGERMDTTKNERKIRLSDEVNCILKSDAERFGMTINSYITHLILKEHEKNKAQK